MFRLPPVRDDEPALVMAVVVFLYMLVLVPRCVEAQPTGTWTTHFEDTGVTAWLVIRPPALLVVNQNEEGRCMAVPARVRWDGLTPTNRDWQVRQRGDSLTVTLPPTRPMESEKTVTYHRTTEDPRTLCNQIEEV
jgi:hypothetical protein